MNAHAFFSPNFFACTLALFALSVGALVAAEQRACEDNALSALIGLRAV